MCLCARSVIFECRGRGYLDFVFLLMFFFSPQSVGCFSPSFFFLLNDRIVCRYVSSLGSAVRGGGALHSIATAFILLYTVLIVLILYQSCFFA